MQEKQRDSLITIKVLLIARAGRVIPVKYLFIWGVTMSEQNQLAVYERYLDAGNCLQLVVVKNGQIVGQKIDGVNGSFYTGDGNPEFVGQSKSVLRGKGFKKTRPGRGVYSESEYKIWMHDLLNELLRKSTF